jgi:hypothetical protein
MRSEILARDFQASAPNQRSTDERVVLQPADEQPGLVRQSRGNLRGCWDCNEQQPRDARETSRAR